MHFFVFVTYFPSPVENLSFFRRDVDFFFFLSVEPFSNAFTKSL